MEDARIIKLLEEVNERDDLKIIVRLKMMYVDLLYLLHIVINVIRKEITI